jgi:hypothetical protein
MKNIYRLFLSIVMVLTIIFGPLMPMTMPVLAQGTGCASSSPSSGAYTVTLCFSDPLDGSTLVGDTPITVTISISGRICLQITRVHTHSHCPLRNGLMATTLLLLNH